MTREDFEALENKMYNTYCNGGQFDTLLWVALDHLNITVDGIDTQVMLNHHGIRKAETT